MKETMTVHAIASLCNAKLTPVKSSSIEKDSEFPTYRVYVRGAMVDAECDMVTFTQLCREQGMTVEVNGPREAIVDQNPTFVGTDCTPFGASF